MKEREVLPPSLTLARTTAACLPTAACALVPQRLVHASLGSKRARSSRRWSTSPPAAAVQASRSSWARHHVGAAASDRAASPARPLHGAQGMQEGVLRRIGPAMAARLQREQEAGGQVGTRPHPLMARVQQQEAAAAVKSSLGQSSSTAARWRHETIKKTPPALESPQHSMASSTATSSEVSESRPTVGPQPVSQ